MIALNSIILLLLLIFIGNADLLGQQRQLLIQLGDNLYAEQNYYGATTYYQREMNIDSLDVELLYKFAESNRLWNNYHVARSYYKKIYDKDPSGRLFPENLAHLANMYKIEGKYLESQMFWKKAKSQYGRDKKSYLYLKSVQELNSIQFALQNNKDVSNTSVLNLGSPVNSPNSEFAPSWFDGRFYFTSLRASKIKDNLEIKSNDYTVKIYRLDSVIEALSPIINHEDYHNGNFSFDESADFVYFSRCDALNKCKIYRSKKSGENWKIAEELPATINLPNCSNSQPSIAQVGTKKYLLFVSDRIGGEGNLDIWRSEIISDNFTAPVNLGKTINSPDNEVTPFYNSKDERLYFSSTWHEGFGGYDIFSSKGNLLTQAIPENLMLPINSTWNDFYYIRYEEDAYFTSNRIGIIYTKGPTCCNDIWKIENTVPTPTVTKPQAENDIVLSKEVKTVDDLNKYLPVTLYFHNDHPAPRSLDTIVRLNYITTYEGYRNLIPTYRNAYSEGLEGEQKITAQNDIQDFFDHYAEKGVEDLKKFTHLLLIALEKGEKIEVSIKGFASPLAKTDYNVNLSKRRISTFIKYLREYDRGQFNAYIDKTAQNGGELTFEKIPFGEYTAAAGVSDDYYDQRNSIYNRSACLERKIEIQTVRKAEYPEGKYAELHIESSTHDFGKAKTGEILTHDFIIKNIGKENLEIQKIASGCNCAIVEADLSPLPPGGTRKIRVKMDTQNLSGKQVKSLTIVSNAFPNLKRLVLTAEILEK